MKIRNLWVAGVLGLCCWALPGAQAQEVMSVQVRNAELRATPSFMGKPVSMVPYGTKVTVASQKGAWVLVNAIGKQGWVNQTALTKRQLSQRAGSENARTGATSDEMALAGKGFSADVESEFKKEHPQLDFTWVNRMEKITYTPAQLSEFLAAGDVTSKGGAQ